MIAEEFSRLQRERVNEAELEAAQDYAVGHFPLTIETPDQIATQVLNQLFYELPVEELPKYPRSRARASRPTTSSAWRASSSGRTACRWCSSATPTSSSATLKGVGLRRLRAHRHRPGGRALGRPQETVKVMLSCGEPSGDLYAGALVRALRAREPQLEAFGLGGPGLAAAGARLVADFRRALGHRTDRGAEGPAQVAGHLPAARRGRAPASGPTCWC